MLGHVVGGAMTLRTTLLLALLGLMPTAFATGLVSWPVAIGVATPGSVDEHDSGEVCLAVVTPMTLEVALVVGGAADAILVTADAVGTEDPAAYATIGAPVLLRFLSPDSCAHFRVEGTFVETVALYEGVAAPVGEV